MTQYKYLSVYNARSWSNIKRTPKRIMIHHWGIKGQKFTNVLNWFVKTAKTSAHYMAEDKLVACLVAPGRVAWHAGVWARNLTDIGIECRPEKTDGDFETVAQLVADLRRVYGNLPLVPHSSVRNTACPGRWNHKGELQRLSNRANAILRGESLPSKKIHTVRKGETVYGISGRYGTTVPKIAALNKAIDVAVIYPGMKIRVA